MPLRPEERLFQRKNSTSGYGCTPGALSRVDPASRTSATCSRPYGSNIWCCCTRPYNASVEFPQRAASDRKAHIQGIPAIVAVRGGSLGICRIPACVQPSTIHDRVSHRQDFLTLHVCIYPSPTCRLFYSEGIACGRWLQDWGACRYTRDVRQWLGIA